MDGRMLEPYKYNEQRYIYYKIKGDMTQKMFCFHAMPLSFLCPILTENLFNEHPFHSYSNNTVLINALT